jgi:DNA topoisomerase-1
MGKSLVIVESPAKIKTINKILGKDYIVKSSIGHIRDLGTLAPASASKARSTAKTKAKGAAQGSKDEAKMGKLVQRMGIDPQKGWLAHYEILPGKAKVLQGLQEYAKKVDKIYLATDLDREGEAIAWHLREAIGGDDSKYQRVTFTEITKKAVLSAFDKPGTINLDRVDAYKARRFLDRVVGFMLSPLLWQKVARGLSAGRVQSVAVRLISEREKEIHAFKTQEYWEIHSLVNKGTQSLKLELVKRQGQALKLSSQQEVEALLPALRSKPYTVSEVETKSNNSTPPAPFITSTLQQAASVRLGYSVKKTMTLAQKLYEAGLITYMRTDSTNLSAEAVEVCRTYIGKVYGKSYLPEKPQTYSSKKSAQEAHEAIRPSDITVSAAKVVAELGSAELGKLYQLIWSQFVACQMTNATYDSTSVVVHCGEFELKARGRVLTFDGFLKVLGSVSKKGEEEQTMPAVVRGEVLKLKEVLPSQHFTKPPPRYTEANLVKELVKRGIGRPSTYATIISTIQDRGYVKIEKRRFFCLKIGEIVTDRLVENFQDLMDFGFTAALEEDLDKIAAGQENWQQVLDTFYANFTKRLESASEAMRGNPPVESSIPCPNCGRPMNIRTARTGVFMSCSGYGASDGEPCKQTINLIPGEEVVDDSANEDDEEGNDAEIRAKKRCPRCDTAMDSYLVDASRKLHVCGNNPECPGLIVETGTFRIKGYEGPVIQCDKCGKDMQLKTGRFGKYFACTGAPECANTRKLLRNGEAAPPKVPPIPMPELPCSEGGGYFVLRDGAAGLFLAASTFPKSRETRKPTVADLRRHKDKIDPKYAYLLKAPDKDPAGNAATIRFSRKSKQHFIMSEIEGKATNWALFWRDGKWQEGVE